MEKGTGKDISKRMGKRLNIQVNGKMVNATEKEKLSFNLGIFLYHYNFSIYFINFDQELNMRENFKMVISMEKEYSDILQETTTKENF